MNTTSDSREYGNTEQYHKNGLRLALLLNALHFRGVIPSRIRVHRQRGFVFLQIDAFHGASLRLRIYNAKALLVVAYNHTRRIGPRAALIQKACVRQLRNGLVLFSPLHLFHLRNESNNGVHAWRLQKWLPTALAASPNCSTTISDIVVQCQRAIVMCPIRSLSFQIAFSS